MSKRCLAVYDVTRIQDFVFGPNKLKENIGGSLYIHTLFQEKLVSIIKQTLGTENETVITEWEKANTFSLPANQSLKADVIYIGGGNAMVAFASKDDAVNVTKALSKMLLEETQNTLGVAVAYVETDFENYTKDKRDLFKMLNINKDSYSPSAPLRNIGITYECTDGLPSEGKKDVDSDKKYISRVAARKQLLSQDKSNFDSIFDDVLGNSYRFPNDFDLLGGKEGESHIAVVHIDGNNMGQFIDSRLSKISDFGKAITEMRWISKKTSEAYQTVFAQLVEELIDALKLEGIDKKLRRDFDDKERQWLPIRPVILSGDDLTFVSDGRIGIQLAVRLLQLLEERPDRETFPLSACAGIAIVKSHFPLYRAYDLAEQLCASAKQKAKALNPENPGSWLDYHIVYSGFEQNLNDLRTRMYSVPGMAKPSRPIDFPQNNLLLRPFCVEGENVQGIDRWKNILNLYETMTKKWPRSRLKTLRNNFIISEEAVQTFQKINSSRGANYQLPRYEMNNTTCHNNKLFIEYQTPYFEPLELIDFYLPEFQLVKAEEK
jgi:hypothetical protein